MLAVALGCIACGAAPAALAGDGGDPPVTGRLTVTRGDAGFGAVADTYVWASQPDRNMGDLPYLFTGDVSGHKRALLRFELAGVPAGSTVTSATLSLTQSSSSGQQVRVRRALAGWDEAWVTWTSASGATRVDPEVAGAFESQPGVRVVELAALVQAWVDGLPNDGVVLEEDHVPGSDLHSQFHASESPDESARPSLFVTWLGDPAEPAPTSGSRQLAVGFGCSASLAEPSLLAALAILAARLGSLKALLSRRYRSRAWGSSTGSSRSRRSSPPRRGSRSPASG